MLQKPLSSSIMRMRSLLLLVEMLNTCSGVYFHPLPTNSPGRELREPMNHSSKDGELNVTLVFGSLNLADNSDGTGVSVELVGFSSGLGEAATSPGPTLRVRAGDTLRILLINNMPPEVVDTGSIPQGSHDFDVVNLHTHGLHVSPRAPGDDVINTVVPAHKNHPYEYHIPDDHMGGTHWYHPHWHGAVSIHVNFGAAGMIVVEDAENQLPAELRYKDSSTGHVIMEDYIVAAFHVDFTDITRITNKYVQNCICMNTAECHKCQSFFDRKKPKVCKEYNMMCIQQGCKVGTNKDTSMCAAQAAPFFVNPEDFPHTNDNLLLVNGQFEPKLNITANTWVRLRLGLMATGKVL